MSSRGRAHLAALAAAAACAGTGCTLFASLGDLTEGGGASTGAASGGAGGGSSGAGASEGTGASADGGGGGGAGSTAAQGGGAAGSGGDGGSAGGGAATWSHRFGDSAAAQRAISVALDASGNVIVTGHFDGSMQVGAETLVSNGDLDIFVLKLSPEGAPIWAKRFGGPLRDRGYAVEVDGAGDVLLGGDFTGVVDIGGIELTSVGAADALVAKLDGAGAVLWAMSFGSDFSDSVSGIGVDASGEIVAAGIVAGPVTLGSLQIASADPPSLYALRLTGDGTPKWLHGFGGPEFDYANEVAISGDSTWITGTFGGTVDFGDQTLVAVGGNDALLLELADDGAVLAAYRLGGAGDQDSDGIGIGPGGEVYVAADFTGNVYLDGTTVVSASAEDSVVTQVDPSSGAVNWGTQLGGADDQLSRSLCALPDGSTVWAGATDGSLVLRGMTLEGAGSLDAALVKLDASGNPVWVRTFGDAANQEAEDVTVTASGAPIVVGSFEGTIDLGEGPLVSSGGRDVFVARLMP